MEEVAESRRQQKVGLFSEERSKSNKTPSRKLNGLTVLLWLLLLCSVYATIKTLTSSSTSIASHDKNAKYQESSPSSGILSTVAGYRTKNEGSDADGVLATSKKLYSPEGLAVDKEENIFIVGSEDNKICKVTASSGIITTVAGTGTASYSGDGGQATTATLNGPSGVALDTTGNIYIADTRNYRIRKVTVSTGVITTVAGNGNSGSASDNAAATSTPLSSPHDVAVDASGNIFIADSKNSLIRKVTASTGIITKIAGCESKDWGSVCAKSFLAVKDGRSAIATEYPLFLPYGVALDSAGDVYIPGDFFEPCVYKVTVSTGIITVVAGTGPGLNFTRGYNGDGILATKAKLDSPKQVAFDASDNMFINDYGNNRIRRVSKSTGIITTVAGTSSMNEFSKSANAGDGGSAILQSVDSPKGLAVAASGDFYFPDDYHNVVKKVTYTTGTPSSSVTAAPAVTPAMTPSTPSTATAPTPSASSPLSASISLRRRPRLRLLPQGHKALLPHMSHRHSM
jgi:trimeric autotransporter adhesin